MNEQPIGRYIAIALVFVVLFVGVAYLAYRFTRPSNGNQSAFPATSPTPVTQPTKNNGPIVLLPPPYTQAINPYVPANRVYASPQPTVKQVATGNGQNALIMQDGKGNILVNNLTHEEYFQLERERIQASREITLAKETNASRFNESKLQTATDIQRTQQQLAAQGQTAQLAYATELARLDQQTTVARLNNQLELARLQQTYRLAQLQGENDYRTDATEQAYELATLRNNLYFQQNQATSQITPYSYR